MNPMNFFYSFAPLIIVIIGYIVPIIIGYSLLKAQKNISTKNKVIWYIILLVTNYIGLIGLYIFLNTRKE